MHRSSGPCLGSMQLHNITELSGDTKQTSSTTYHFLYITYRCRKRKHNRTRLSCKTYHVTKRLLLHTYYTEKYKPAPIHGSHLPAEPRLRQEPVRGRRGWHGPWTSLHSHDPRRADVAVIEWSTEHPHQPYISEVTSCNFYITYVKRFLRLAFCVKRRCAQLRLVMLIFVTCTLCFFMLCSCTFLRCQTD